MIRRVSSMPSTTSKLIKLRVRSSFEKLVTDEREHWNLHSHQTLEVLRFHQVSKNHSIIWGNSTVWCRVILVLNYRQMVQSRVCVEQTFGKDLNAFLNVQKSATPDVFQQQNLHSIQWLCLQHKALMWLQYQRLQFHKMDGGSVAIAAEAREGHGVA